ncbi:hypothetical protein AYI70_g448 [Smittium culicis]|uniref:Uncharacterized protein n=1 Tax=Smittium culicis TaxID=133412 RepID=A0A1R1YGP2_9FUNG|nr:hypothetical protein AYI70_g448 [Smittium culicis]
MPTNRLYSQNTGQEISGSNIAVPIPVKSGNFNANIGGSNANSVLPVPISDPQKDWKVKSFLDRIVSGAIEMIRLHSENISKIANSAKIKKKLADIKDFGKEMANIDFKRVLNVEKIQPTGSSSVLLEVQPTPRALSEYSPTNKDTKYVQEAAPQKIQSQAPVFQAPVAQAPVAQAPVVQAPVAQAPVAQAPVAQASQIQAPKAQQPMYQAQIAQDPLTKSQKVQYPSVQYPSVNEPVAQVPNYYPNEYQLS